MKKKLIILTTAIALAIGFVSSANAVPTIALSTDGTTFTTVAVDETGTDSANGVPGTVVVTTVNYNGWSVVVNTGTTKPTAGYTAANALMDIQAQATFVGGVGSSANIYIAFSENGFTPVPGGFAGTQTGQLITGTGSATFKAYVGAGTPAQRDTVLNLGTSLFTLTSANSANLFATGSTTTTPTGAPYSITIVQQLTAGGVGSSFSTDSKINAVPEGGSTLVLLGAALTGLGLFAKRKK